MSTKQKNALAAILLMGCILSGCQHAPQYTTVDGIAKAVNQAEQQLAELPGDMAMWDVEAINTVAADPIHAVLKGALGTITINAQVKVPAAPSFFRGNLVTSSLTDKQLCDVFFKDKTKDAKYNPERYEYVVPIDISKPINYKSDGDNNIDQILNRGKREINYIYLPLYKKYHQATPSENPKLDRSDFPIEAAIQSLRAILSKVGIDHIDIFKTDVFSTLQNEIQYNILFTPIYEGIPYINPFSVSTALASQIPQASAGISKEGLVSLSGSILMQIVQTGKMEEVVAIDHILETIPDMIGSKISLTGAATVNRIELRYMVKTGKLALVWDFGFEDEKKPHLIFNAETGQLEDVR